MPSCLLSNKTILQTTNGWCAVESETSLRDVLGVNQQGTHSTSVVSIEFADTNTTICYLGTRAAFGGFHPETKLVTANGSVTKAAALVATDTFQNVDFELAADLSRVSTNTNLDSVWNQLSAGAVIRTAEYLIFRIMSDAALPSSLRTDWLSVKSEVGNRYVLIEKPGFLASLSRKGAHILWDLFAFIYLKENSLSFERQNYVFALWCASYLGNARQKYGLTYDSIQHSATVIVDLTQKSSSIEQIRTAFAADQGRVLRLQWADHHWYPVASGFAVVD
jgi:hypothetical protein